MSDAYIFDAVRTPRAKRKGKFATVHPIDLLTFPLKAIIERSKISADKIEDVPVGCVTQTGEQGWCVGRAAVLAAGFPVTVPATTINRLCGSGQQAFNFAAQGVLSGTYDLAIAAGLEHMTRVPMFSDSGGEDSPALKKLYPDLVNQGLSAEIMAKEFGFSRKEVDTFSYYSQVRAAQARAEGRFKGSIIPVCYTAADGQTGTLSEDDNIRAETTIEGLGGLKLAFKEDGVITAGNASAIVDGAAAILVGSKKAAEEMKLKPRARFVSSAAVGSPPKIMLTGPVAATQLALKKAGLSVKDISVWEINEAFAPVPLFTMKELGLRHEQINVNGGGIALGHPLGATGAMLVGMALDELERTQTRYAVVTMCIGLGMGIATVIERI